MCRATVVHLHPANHSIRSPTLAARIGCAAWHARGHDPLPRPPARDQRRRSQQGADGGPARTPRVARPHQGLHVHRQRQRDPELRPQRSRDQARARGSAAQDVQARQRADRGPGPDAGAAPRRRPEAAQGLRRPSGDVPQRRGLPDGDRRAHGDEGIRPATRRRRRVAGNGRDLLAAAQRAADQEPPRQDRRAPRPTSR